MPVTVIRDINHLSMELTNAGGKLSVLDFTATWCGPCKHISPEFDRLSSKFSSAKFFKVDVDECSDVAQEYNVRSMPTFVFVKNQQEVDRFSGADPSLLESKIKKHGSIDGFSGSGYTLNSNASTATTSGSTSASSSNTSQGLSGWLGSLIGSVSGSTVTSSTASTNSAAEEDQNQTNEIQAREIFPVDKSRPTCKIQIRLLDGKKLSVIMNANHTVDQLRQYITIARPNYANIEFVMATGHPTKPIEDETKTLENSYLANAVVVIQQRKRT